MNRPLSGRSSNSDADMSHTWQALMAGMGGTIRGTRCATRGIAVDNEHPLYANQCELAVELVVTSQAINRDRGVALRSSCVNRQCCRCILSLWDQSCSLSVGQDFNLRICMCLACSDQLLA
jgi:hypothetical protein